MVPSCVRISRSQNLCATCMPEGRGATRPSLKADFASIASPSSDDFRDRYDAL